MCWMWTLPQQLRPARCCAMPRRPRPRAHAGLRRGAAGSTATLRGRGAARATATRAARAAAYACFGCVMVGARQAAPSLPVAASAYRSSRGTGGPAAAEVHGWSSGNSSSLVLDCGASLVLGYGTRWRTGRPVGMRRMRRRSALLLSACSAARWLLAGCAELHLKRGMNWPEAHRCVDSGGGILA